VNDETIAPLAPLLRELETFGREHDARETEHKRKMLNLDRETAELVYILLLAGNRKTLLEIGTSNGYSTIWLAAAAKANGGTVVSIDRNPEKHAMARENIGRAGLRDYVTLVTGDATETIAAVSGTFDAVFFDADRISAPAQLQLLESRLTPNALLLCDNVLSHPAEVTEYLQILNAKQGWTAATFAIGKGLHVAYRRPR
jgi:predicted O-methyltransferase YrrM